MRTPLVDEPDPADRVAEGNQVPPQQPHRHWPLSGPGRSVDSPKACQCAPNAVCRPLPGPTAGSSLFSSSVSMVGPFAALGGTGSDGGQAASTPSS
jgi:hypothetical protein